MATGGASGQYKPEHEYFCRYFRLVNETGAKPLRKLLDKEAANRNMTVDAFLGTKRHKFCTLVQRNIIRQGQFDVIFPTQTALDFHNLDITLLCCIIKTVCKLSPNGTIAMEDLREARNELCHDSIPEMQESIYKIRFSKIRFVIKQLLFECGDKSFEARIEQEMNIVNSDYISSAQTVEIIKTYIDNQKEENVKMVSDNMIQLRNTISQTTNELTIVMKNVQATVEKQPEVTTNAVENLWKTQREEEDTKPKVHPSLEPVRQQTEVILNEVSDFVDTQQFHEVEKMLLDYGNVIITGGAGEGKTYTAIEIMRRHRNEDNCIQINRPSDVFLIDPRIFEFVFIDDIFGNTELDESKFKSWFPVLEKLQQLVNAGELKLIIASREICLKERIQSLSKFPMFSKMATLRSTKLSPAEKMEILSKALKKKQRSCTQETVQKCVSAFKSDIGFPYMCILFSSDEQFFHEGDLFFKRNLLMNSGIISQLTPSKQMSLLFLWMKGNKCPVVLNRSEENDKILFKLSSIVRHERDTDIDGMYDAIYTSLKVMDAVFISVKADGFWFAHNSIYKSCGLYLAQKGLHREIIKNSNLAFFMEHITISESVYRADCVFVRENLYPNIVDRVISEVMVNDHAREMAVHPCLSHDILTLLIKTLEKRKQLKEFLLCDNYQSNGQKYKSFVAHYIETCAPNTCRFLEQILSLMKRKRLFTHKSKERGCRTYQIQLHACHGACRGGNIEAFKLIETIEFDGDVLVDIAGSGNTDMYKYVKDRLDNYEVFKEEPRALVKCVKKGDIKMYKAMRQSGCQVPTNCIDVAIKRKKFDLLKLIIDDLAQSGNMSTLAYFKNENEREILMVKVLRSDEKLIEELHEKEIKLDSIYLRLVLDSYCSKILLFHHVGLAVSDCLPNNQLSFKENNVMTIYDRSKKESAPYTFVLEEMEISLKESIFESVYSRNSTQLKLILSCELFEINKLLPDILREIRIQRQRLDRDCEGVLIERIQAPDCNQSLKLLCSVMFLKSDENFQTVYSLSPDDIKALQKKMIQSAMEEAVFMRKSEIYLCILTKFRIEPTTFCLIYCLYHRYEYCFAKTLDMLEITQTISDDPNFKQTVALCREKPKLEKFWSLLKFSKFCTFCDTEMSFRQ